MLQAWQPLVVHRDMAHENINNFLDEPIFYNALFPDIPQWRAYVQCFISSGIRVIWDLRNKNKTWHSVRHIVTTAGMRSLRTVSQLVQEVLRTSRSLGLHFDTTNTVPATHISFFPQLRITSLGSTETVILSSSPLPSVAKKCLHHLCVTIRHPYVCKDSFGSWLKGMLPPVSTMGCHVCPTDCKTDWWYLLENCTYDFTYECFITSF